LLFIAYAQCVGFSDVTGHSRVPLLSTLTRNAIIRHPKTHNFLRNFCVALFLSFSQHGNENCISYEMTTFLSHVSFAHRYLAPLTISHFLVLKRLFGLGIVHLKPDTSHLHSCDIYVCIYVCTGVSYTIHVERALNYFLARHLAHQSFSNSCTMIRFVPCVFLPQRGFVH
jgi:hypothetical protein